MELAEMIAIMQRQIGTLQEQMADACLKLEGQARYLGSLTQKMDALEAGKPSSSAPSPEGTIPRGKYRGRLHADIVMEDPWHIQWMADNGYAKGMGYTDEQIAEAREAGPQPTQRR